MPAPRRAILADVNDLKLDPKVKHVEVSKSGKLINPLVVNHKAVKETVFENKIEPKEKKVEVRHVIKQEDEIIEDITTSSIAETSSLSEEPKTSLNLSLQEVNLTNNDVLDSLTKNSKNNKKKQQKLKS